MSAGAWCRYRKPDCGQPDAEGYAAFCGRDCWNRAGRPALVGGHNRAASYVSPDAVPCPADCPSRAIAGTTFHTHGRVLAFHELRGANLERCNKSFHPEHGINEWTPTDWATAMAGECGEACNEVKKLRRLETAPHWNQGADDANRPEAIKWRIGKELADLVIYTDLLAARLGIDLGDVVRAKFNEVSERVGSDVRL